MDNVLRNEMSIELVEIIMEKVHRLNFERVFDELKHRYRFYCVHRTIRMLGCQYRDIRPNFEWCFRTFHQYYFGRLLRDDNKDVHTSRRTYDNYEGNPMIYSRHHNQKYYASMLYDNF